MGELAGKVAVVTGGSGALGSVIARALATAGASVLLVGRDATRLAEAVKAVTDAGGKAVECNADITSDDGPHKIVDAALEAFGRLDILVNSAGHFAWTKLLDIADEDWFEALDVNVTAPFRLMRAAAKHMIGQGQGGAILNIGSIHAMIGDGTIVPHCASKAALHGLTLAAADGLRAHGIRANLIHPGQIAKDSGDRHAEGPDELVTQADIAAMALHLCSDACASVTGSAVEMFGKTRSLVGGASYSSRASSSRE
ncbi:MAG: SDR family oxidoreductase [Myxococcota bacterium]